MKKSLFFSCLLLLSAMASAQTYKNVYSAKKDWARIYDYFHYDDVVSPFNGLTIDDSGSVYVTGTSTIDTLGNTVAFYNKYGPDGRLLWNKADSLGITIGTAILWDSIQQRIYGSGANITSFGGVGLSGEYVLNMIRSNAKILGEFLWPDPGVTKRLPHYASANNICEDKGGKVYVTGEISGYLSSAVLHHKMLTTMKIDGTDSANGIKWMNSYDSTNLLEETGQFIVLDPHKNVIVAGIRGDSSKYKENFSLLCVKYDSSGNIKWRRKFINEDTFYLTEASGLVVSNSGSAYMSGNIPNKNAQSMDGIILKYTNAGKLAWTKRVSSFMLHTQDAACNGLALDKNGNILAIGFIDNDSGEYATLVKLDSNGQQIWIDTLQDPYNGTSITQGIAMTQDDTGNIYITGTRGDNQTFLDIFTVRYNSAGQKQWYTRYNDSALSYNSPSEIMLDKKGNVIVAGSHNGDTATGADILVLKYSQYMTKVKVHNSGINENEMQTLGIELFPNPFTNQLNGAINLTTVSDVNISIFDITGRVVKAINYKDMQAGKNNFEIPAKALEKGLYFYKCIIENQSGTITLNGKIVKE